MPRIDLNADIGEYQDGAGQEMEREILAVVTSCNIACGGHTGDEKTMRETLAAAKAAGVAAGAHPSYPDREGFGRRHMSIEAAALEASLHEQIQALEDIADEFGVTLTHVKPHGALYNAMADDPALAKLVAGVVASRNAQGGGTYALVGLPGSAAQEAAREAGLRFLGEAFVDRRYTDEGRLQPRGEDGAVIEDEADRLVQALALASGEPVLTASGGTITIAADTLCLHGDSPGALETARAVHRALTKKDFTIAAVSGEA